MPRRQRNLAFAIVGLLLVFLVLWQVQREQGSGVIRAEPTQAEQALLALLDYGEASKYTITSTLPVGTTIRVWIEAYEFGTRVDDIAACEVHLMAKQQGLSFFCLRQDTKVALTIGQPPMGVARGEYPVERWADLPDAMLTSEPPGGNLFDGSLVLQVLTYGVHGQWADDYLNYAQQLSDHRTREQLIAGVDYVYILKAQAILRPRQ